MYSRHRTAEMAAECRVLGRWEHQYRASIQFTDFFSSYCVDLYVIHNYLIIVFVICVYANPFNYLFLQPNEREEQIMYHLARPQRPQGGWHCMQHIITAAQMSHSVG